MARRASIRAAASCDRGVATPRPLAGQRLVQDETQAVDVRGGGRRLALGLLRAEVVDRPERRAGDGTLGIGGQPGDPEVGDHRPPIAGEQDVARLDVAMDDPADVGDTECPGHVEADLCGLGRREATTSAKARGEILALDQLHDQERLAVVGARLQAGDDVRVAQDGGRQGLAPKTHRDVGIGRPPRDAAA